MQILPVNSNYTNYNRTSFKSFEATEAANNIFKNLKKPEQEFIANTTRRLSSLVHWDMVVDASKDWRQVISIKFVNKHNKNLVHNEGIEPIRRINNTVRVSSPDLPKDKTTDLIFPNETRAQALMDLYSKQLETYEKNDVHHHTQVGIMLRLKNAANEIEFLDEAYRYMAKINPNLYTETSVTPSQKIPRYIKLLYRLLFIDC